MCAENHIPVFLSSLSFLYLVPFCIRNGGSTYFLVQGQRAQLSVDNTNHSIHHYWIDKCCQHQLCYPLNSDLLGPVIQRVENIICLSNGALFMCLHSLDHLNTRRVVRIWDNYVMQTLEFISGLHNFYKSQQPSRVQSLKVPCEGLEKPLASDRT